MAQERHYKVGKSLIQDGTIITFSDIFEYVPKSTIAKDLQMHFNTLQSRIDQPGSFSIQELSKLSDLFEIDPLKIITLAYTQFAHDKKPKKKK